MMRWSDRTDLRGLGEKNMQEWQEEKENCQKMVETRDKMVEDREGRGEIELKKTVKQW